MNSPCARPSPRGGPWSVASPACRRDTLPLALVAADVMGRFFFGVSSRQGWDGQPGMGRLVRQRQRYSSTITVILIYLDGGEVLCAEYSALAMYCRETGRVEADVGWDGMGWMAVGNNGIVLFAMLDWTGFTHTARRQPGADKLGGFDVIGVDFAAVLSPHCLRNTLFLLRQ